MSTLVPRSCPTCSSIGPRRLIEHDGQGVFPCPDPWHEPAPAHPEREMPQEMLMGTLPDGPDRTGRLIDVEPATAPETPAEPPRSAQQPPAGIPGSPNPAEGHTEPRIETPWDSLDRWAALAGTTLAAAGIDPAQVAAWDYQAPSGAETRHTLALRLRDGQHVTLTGPGPGGGASVARTGPEPAPDDAWAILGEVEDGIRRLDDAIRPLKLASDRSWAATQEHGRQILQYRLTKAQERIETITGLLALRDGELASANAQRDQARAEVERLRDEVERLRAAMAEHWPCPNPEDPEGCYCPSDGPHVAVREIRREAGLT